ncbi:MAG TPA: gamma-glutamyltransferase, partial [Steroidobacteraceae bacterium]|nr:gamma-glutamyltransferase [Steroidobacteraceae bacterium]
MRRRDPCCLRELLLLFVAVALSTSAPDVRAQARTQKPPLHGQHWIAITGKPLGATAGAMIFQQGGNAVDAACAMLAATATMWDVLHWGGETQALIYDPRARKVVAINGLGVAPTGATAEFFRDQGLAFPPEYGAQAAVTPGTPGALLRMLAEFGTMSLAEVLAPAIALADGYPIEAQTVAAIERHEERLIEWPNSRRTLLPNEVGGMAAAPEPGQIFRQPELAATLRKLVEAEREALAAGRSRQEAIEAAYERFYRGDIARE